MANALSSVSRVVGLGALISVPLQGCACAGNPVQEAPPRETRASSLGPVVQALSSIGLQRGVESELSARGTGLSENATLVAPFRFTVAGRGPRRSDPTTFDIRITVDPATPLGTYPARVLTEDGFSDPFPLVVGQLPQVRETEGRQTVETAPLYPSPVAIEGDLSSERDWDYFRFRGRKGGRVLVAPQFAQIGSRFDPSISLLSMDRGSQWGSEQNFGYPADAPLFAALPRDGDYVVVLHRAFHPIRGGRPNYRVVLGEVPAAGTVYPLGGCRGGTISVELRGGTLEGVITIPVRLQPAPGESVVRVRATTLDLGPGGTPLDVEAVLPLVVDDLPERLEPTAPGAPPARASAPVIFNGRLDPPGEDRFILDVTPGQRLRVDVAANDLGSPLVPTLRVLDSKGAVLAAPTTRVVPACGPVAEYLSYDPEAEFTVPEGQWEATLVIGCRSSTPPEFRQPEGAGSPYRIKVVPVAAGFEVMLDDAQVAVPRGGTAAVGVTVIRKGFVGPITLGVANPPAGLTVRAGTVAEGQTVGALTVTAGADASFGPVVLDVVGEGRGAIGPLRAHAKRLITFGPQTTAPFRTVAGRLDGEAVYDESPAYLRAPVMTQTGLFAAPVRAIPIALDAPADAIDAVRGRTTRFKVKVTCPNGSRGPLRFRPLALPDDLTVPEVTIDATTSEAEIAVDTARAHPLGAVSLVLKAMGMVAGVERSLAVPAVTLRVVPEAGERLGLGTECTQWDSCRSCLLLELLGSRPLEICLGKLFFCHVSSNIRNKPSQKVIHCFFNTISEPRGEFNFSRRRIAVGQIRDG